jgi:GT2 family glycosyltransferase
VLTVSAVVPASDGSPTLPRCLAAIERAADGPDEVVVVDGPVSLSAAGARNIGVERATGDVVVFVDADVEVHPDAFSRIRHAFAEERDTPLTAVFGSYDSRPATPTTVSTFRNLLHHHVHQHGAGAAETFWTGLGAVRRHAFLAAGGFDEGRYPHPSVEDIELGHRLTDRGAVIRLDPCVQGTHLKRWTLRTMLWTDFARRGIPWVRLQVLRRRPASTLNCGWRHRLSALTCAFGVVGGVLLHPLVALAAAGNLVALNHSFYALLVRQQGLTRAAAGVGLHGLHHLVAVAALLVGIVLAAPEALRGAERRAAVPRSRPRPTTAPVPAGEAVLR